MVDQQISEAVLDKAQKLLALASRGGTEAEAQAAAKKLQELCFKYNLDISRVEASSRHTKAYHETKIDVGAKTGWIAEWRISLVHTIARYNFCRALTWRGTSTVSLLGREVNIQIVFHMYEYLSSTINRLRIEMMKGEYFKSEYEKRVWSSSFCKGAVYRLNERLEDQWRQDMASHNQETGLVIAEQDNLDQAFEKLWPSVERRAAKRKIHLEAYFQGVQAGSDISLNKQLKKEGY